MEYDGFRLGVLLDPSLILGEKSLSEVMEYVDQLNLRGFGYRFYIPPAFISAVEELDPEKEEIIFYSEKAKTVDLKHLKDLMYILGKKQALHTYEIPGKIRDRYAGIYGQLLHDTGNKEVAEILLQEWIFLQENNLMISRIKKPFNYFIRAGAIVVEYTGRPPHIEKEDALADLEGLRKMGRWTALAGKPIKELTRGLTQALDGEGIFLLAGSD